MLLTARESRGPRARAWGTVSLFAVAKGCVWLSVQLATWCSGEAGCARRTRRRVPRLRGQCASPTALPLRVACGHAPPRRCAAHLHVSGGCARLRMRVLALQAGSQCATGSRAWLGVAGGCGVGGSCVPSPTPCALSARTLDDPAPPPPLRPVPPAPAVGPWDIPLQVSAAGQCRRGQVLPCPSVCQERVLRGPGNDHWGYATTARTRAPTHPWRHPHPRHPAVCNHVKM